MNPLRPLARRLGRARWFARAGRWMVPVDAALQRRTNGRVGLLVAAGIDGLLLTTTGRRSGAPRSVPLLAVRVPDGYVIAGSNWGGPHHPAWSANLLANPSATVTLDGRTERVIARLAAGDERDRLWRLLTTTWPAYDNYADRAGRDIRVFLLTPAAD
ncbi:MAG TPA: nitroreductase/quinone reductase family protein [Pseudonocardiaceae bacterium]